MSRTSSRTSPGWQIYTGDVINTAWGFDQGPSGASCHHVAPSVCVCQLHQEPPSATIAPVSMGDQASSWWELISSQRSSCLAPGISIQMCSAPCTSALTSVGHVAQVCPAPQGLPGGTLGRMEWFYFPWLEAAEQ